jgi:Zn-finger nucleic acid-binding protein
MPAKNQDGVCILGEASGELCPVCKVPLMHASMLHQRFLFCTRCGGSLIPMLVFLALVRDLRARGSGVEENPHPPDPRELQRALRCPKCGAAMDTHYYEGGGNVVIDDCSHCELNWLDAGELQTIGRAGEHTIRDSRFGMEEREA